VLLRELWVERMDEVGTDPDPPEEPEPYEPKPRANRLRRALKDLLRL
jgi:hypothetical protein